MNQELRTILGFSVKIKKKIQIQQNYLKYCIKIKILSQFSFHIIFFLSKEIWSNLRKNKEEIIIKKVRISF